MSSGLRIPTRPRSKMFHFQSMPRMKSSLTRAGTGGDTWNLSQFAWNPKQIRNKSNTSSKCGPDFFNLSFFFACYFTLVSQTRQAAQSCFQNLQRRFSLETETADLIYFRVNNDVLQLPNHRILSIFTLKSPTQIRLDNKLAEKNPHSYRHNPHNPSLLRCLHMFTNSTNSGSTVWLFPSKTDQKHWRGGLFATMRSKTSATKTPTSVAKLWESMGNIIDIYIYNIYNIYIYIIYIYI